MKEVLSEAITDIFCSSKIIEFNGAKWIGFDESLDSYLQHHSVNSLGFAAWNKMLGRPYFFPENCDSMYAQPDMPMLGDVDEEVPKAVGSGSLCTYHMDWILRRAIYMIFLIISVPRKDYY